MEFKRIFLFVTIILAMTLTAQVPRTMNYQGKLTDGDGIAVHAPAGIAVTFRIYDVSSGGTALWSEAHASVTVTNGLFDVILGETTPMTMDFDDQYWMELVVGGETLTPREQLSAVPYSHRAVYSDTALVIGSGAVQTTARLDGDGTAGAPLDIAQQEATNGQILKWNGSSWAPAADEEGGSGTVTSIATNDGITGGTITTTGTIGLTGQALALHNLSTNGLIARTGSGTVAGRTITASTGISVSNGNGVSGNPTITNTAPWTSSSDDYIQNQVSADQTAGFRITGDGLFNGGKVGIGTSTPTHRLEIIPNNDDRGISINHTKTSSGNAYGIYNVLYNDYTGNAVGYGTLIDIRNNTSYLNNSNQYGIWTRVRDYGSGDAFGYYAYSRKYGSPPTGTNYGFYSSTSYGSSVYGVYASATDGLTNYGIYATASDGATNWAGYFEGNVGITGNLDLREMGTNDILDSDGDAPTSVGDILAFDGTNYNWQAQSSGTDDQTLQEVYNEDGNNVLMTATHGDIQFRNDGGDELLFLNEFSGRVGIGTVTPTQKLDVNGQIRIRGGSTPAVGDVLTATSTDGTADWQTPSGSADGDWELDVDGYVLYSGGDWGLSRYGNSLLTSGTSSPDAINTHVNWGVNSTTGISTGFDVYYATVGGGGDNNAYGYGSTISGGRNNEAGTYSVVGGGSNNNAGNWLGFVGGGEDNSSTGQYAVVPGGYGNTAQSYGEVVCGLFATVGSGSWNSWIGTDRLFVVGNGTGTSSRSDAMTILKNGNVGIGTTSPTAKLEVANGDALIYGITVGRGAGAVSTNTVVGSDALSSNTTGQLNTAIGYRSQQLNLSTQDNTSLGGHALMNNRANFNTAVGAYSLSANTSGTRNSALGHSALAANETADDNTAVGYYALANNIVGIDNTAVGSKSLESNINNRNTAVGSNTLNQNTVGSDNTAVGYYTLARNQVGVSNSALGSQALENLNPPSAAPQGFYNSAVGHKALQSLSTGYGNTAMGYFAGQAGTALTTGYYNTGIGYQASFDANNRINTIVLAGNGNLALGGSNRVRIGNSSMTSIGGQVLWTALSDERIKTDVEEDVPGLAFITKLRPVTYSFDIDKQDELMWGAKNESDWEGKYDIESIRFSGFIAQEVEKAAKSINYSFSGIDKPDDDGLYGIRYAEFVVPLVKAVQELTAENAELRSEIERLKALEARIEALENK